MARNGTRSHPKPEHVPSSYAWALPLLVFAVYFPLLWSRVTVGGDNFVLFESWLAPSGSRAVHVLLHAAATVVVFQLGRRLLRGTTVTFWAALLFAVHPVHVDALARVPNWLELTSVLLVLTLLLFVLGLQAVAASYPLRAASLLSSAVLWLALEAGACYLTGPGDSGNPLLSEPASTRFMTGINVMGRYLKLLVWPFRLSPDYSYNSVPAVTDPLSAGFIVPLLCIVTLLLLAAIRARQNNFYLVSCGSLLICAFPVWGLGMPLLAERWLYFPSAVFCWSLVLFLRDAGLVPRPDWHDRWFVRSALVLVGFLVLPWSAKTYIRSRQWGDEKVLLQQAALTVPGNAHIQLLLGNYYERTGDYLGAQRSYRRALEIKPSLEEAGLKLAAAYRQTGTYAKALDTAQRLVPSGAQGRALRAVEIARTYVAIDDYARAAAVFEEGLRYAETDAATHRELGMLYLSFLGQPDRGRRHLRRSLELDPGQPAAAEIRSVLARP